MNDSKVNMASDSTEVLMCFVLLCFSLARRGEMFSVYLYVTELMHAYTSEILKTLLTSCKEMI